MRSALIGILLAGCTLYESGGPGGDDDVGPPLPGGGPIGRSFLVERSQSAPVECTFSGDDQSHGVDVESLSTILVDGIEAASPVVRDAPARQTDGGPPNVAFTVFETWTGFEVSASPTVQYRLWVDSNLITGEASTTFSHNDTTQASPVCSYTWTLTSF